MRVVLQLLLQAGLEPDHGALHEEDLGVALVQQPRLVVPLAALDEHAEDVDAVLGSGRVLVLDHLEVEDKFVNGDLVLTGVVLQSTR